MTRTAHISLKRPLLRRLSQLPPQQARALADMLETSPGASAAVLDAFAHALAHVPDRDAESLPTNLAARLLAGDSPLKVWRRYRGLTCAVLAHASGLSPAYVSEIENGKKPGSVDALKRLAHALDVDVADLI